MSCRRCIERGQPWKGDPPVCAFDENGIFTTANFQCATMNELRDKINGQPEYSGDQYACIGFTNEDNGVFIVLGWYKRRGRTEVFHVIDGTTSRQGRLEDAEHFLENSYL